MSAPATGTQAAGQVPEERGEQVPPRGLPSPPPTASSQSASGSSSSKSHSREASADGVEAAAVAAACPKMAALSRMRAAQAAGTATATAATATATATATIQPGRARDDRRQGAAGDGQENALSQSPSGSGESSNENEEGAASSSSGSDSDSKAQLSDSGSDSCRAASRSNSMNKSKSKSSRGSQGSNEQTEMRASPSDGTPTVQKSETKGLAALMSDAVVASKEARAAVTPQGGCAAAAAAATAQLTPLTTPTPGGLLPRNTSASVIGRAQEEDTQSETLSLPIQKRSFQHRGQQAPQDSLASGAPDEDGVEAKEELGALGVGGDLPPIGGGTTFGTEEASAPRMRWQSRSQFILVLMGYCIGVGNLWRFPYLCGKHGGGAFLVAYAFMLVTVAGPIFFYELVLGQKFQKGPAGTFQKMAPRWVGLAYVPAAMTVCYLPYYQMIVAYSWHYLVATSYYPLPWTTDFTPDAYFEEVVLYRSDGISGPGAGELHWQLVAELFLVWLISAACLVRGIHSAGKAAIVTVSVPLVMIVILLFRCARLEGAGAGLYYYLTPRWGALWDLEVWAVAAGQIIFSLSPGCGTCISMASYHDRGYRGLFTDAICIASCNSGFSLIGGFVVFSVVGNLAHTLGKPVEEVAASGEGLAFIVFPQGLSSIGEGTRLSQFVAFVFFLTFFFLGLNTTFAVVETLQTYINDWILSMYPSHRISQRGTARRLFVLVGLLFCAGLPYTSRRGYYLLEVADHYIVTYCLTIIILLEYILIGTVYGAEQMVKDVWESTEVQLPPVATIHLRYVGPAILLAVVIFLLVQERNNTQEYPVGVILTFGILPVIACLSLIVWLPLRFKIKRLLFGKLYPAFLRGRFASKEDQESIRLRAARGGYADGGDIRINEMSFSTSSASAAAV